MIVVVPEAERARLREFDPLGSGHFFQGSGECIGPVDVERQAAPCGIVAAQFGERSAVGAACDGQQAQARRTARLPAEFDRAHGGAPRCGGQHAPARVAEEDGVDQLRLAARELGNESDDELFLRQAIAQRFEPRCARRIAQVVLGQSVRKRVDVLLHGVAPAAQCVQPGGKGGTHRIMLADGPGPQSVENISSPAARDIVRSDRAGDAQRHWQPGQKNVARWPWTMRRTVAPQRTQAMPARP